MIRWVILGHRRPARGVAKDSPAGEGERDENQQDDAHAAAMLQRGQGKCSRLPTWL